jgi:hypothetical protein
VRLNVEPSGREVQKVVVGIDPGSKKEGVTVKSAAHSYLNLQADAVTWVKDRIETRRQMRRARRSRKTPYRQPRRNRAIGGLPPSVKARWQWKLRICWWLARLYPISGFVVEDVAAHTRGGRQWNVLFSPLQTGKRWFYQELSKLAPVTTKAGWETKQLRDALGLKKTSKKTAEVFEAHCVDSWVLAYAGVGGQTRPDNTRLICVAPLRFHQRQLHYLQPSKGGVRSPYGGTLSLGFKRGSLIKHHKWGVCYVGGTSKGRITLHRPTDGKRLCQNAKPSECKFLTYSTWRTWLAT